jgi:hypothetical protein
MGPLEYVVIEFEGNHFTGEIMPELRALRDQGVVRVVDLLFFQKDTDGGLSARELSDLTPDEARPYGPIAGDLLQFLSEADVRAAAADLPPNSSGAILLLEHTWAIRLREKILEAHGTIVSAGLIPIAEAEALAAELTATQEATLQ